MSQHSCKSIPPAGDRGQRYEIRASTPSGEEVVIGWSDDPSAFFQMVEMHPIYHSRRVVDRNVNPGRKGQPNHKVETDAARAGPPRGHVEDAQRREGP